MALAGLWLPAATRYQSTVLPEPTRGIYTNTPVPSPPIVVLNETPRLEVTVGDRTMACKYVQDVGLKRKLLHRHRRVVPVTVK